MSVDLGSALFHYAFMKALVLAIALLSSGCGYVLRGSTQTVLIDSRPRGAEVQVDGRSYTTPVQVELARGRHHTVTATSSAGAPLATHIESQTQWRYQAADLLLPIIGNIIDGVSGGDSDLVPDRVVMPVGRGAE